jgi:hypothetical protein
MPCAESNTICARRHVTTEPELRRTIASRRLPSSFEISRTRNRSLDTAPPDLVGTTGSDCATAMIKWWIYEAKVR